MDKNTRVESKQLAQLTLCDFYYFCFYPWNDSYKSQAKE